MSAERGRAGGRGEAEAPASAGLATDGGLATPLRTFKLVVAYDGSAYCGWQLQTNGPTIQGELERALSQLTAAPVRVMGSARTDSGVHALGQVVSFRSPTQLSPAVLLRGLNATLPPDVAVLSVEEMPPEFHALRSAVAKRYRYVIDDGPVRDVFQRQRAWRQWQRFDVAAMHRSAQPLVGLHDFASFQTAGSPRRTTVRHIHALEVTRPGDGAVWIEVEANGFLYNMVRAITGTLALVGRGVEDEDFPRRALEARQRAAAGPTAPPQGLFLLWVRHGAGQGGAPLSGENPDAADEIEEP